MGAGDDTFVWNPGDGSDTVDGQDGNDTMIFNGANVNENINLSANGKPAPLHPRRRQHRHGRRRGRAVIFNALGGADTITVGDLSKTDVTEVDSTSSQPAGSGAGDGQADTVIVNGTAGATRSRSPATRPASPSPAWRPWSTSPARRRPTIAWSSMPAGDDVVQASGLAAGAIKLTEDGGNGDDVLIGSPATTPSSAAPATTS